MRSRRAVKSGGAKKPAFREILSVLFWALAISFLLRATVVQAYHVPSGSMEPNMLIGDQFLVSMAQYGLKVPFTGKTLIPLGAPKRGDVVVFKNPDGHGPDYVKRVIGLPGETVETRGTAVFINGRRMADPWGRYAAGGRGSFGPVMVPKNSYFMMGDNRDNSYDSRYWNHGRGGFVAARDIRGKALVILFSLKHDTFAPRWGRFAKLVD